MKRICLFFIAMLGMLQVKSLAQFDLQPFEGSLTNNSLSTPSNTEEDVKPEDSYTPESSGTTSIISKGHQEESEITGLPDSGKPWEKLEGCRLMTERYGDGDSFHVSHRGKEYIFRLYFADAPESSDDKPFRVKTQAKYFGITDEQVLESGHEATTYTWKLLQGQTFTAYTQWLDAQGNSSMPRYFAVLITKDGKNLSELLVENGLARAYGAAANIPGVLKEIEFRRRLDELQEKAKKKKLGAWKFSTKS
ncbi:MAG: thermonuclease family protein [Verrucomicrobiia bacterium]